MARRRNRRAKFDPRDLKEALPVAQAYLGTNVGAATATVAGLAATSPYWIEETAAVVQRLAKAIADGMAGILPSFPNPDLTYPPGFGPPDIGPEPPKPWEIPEDEKDKANLKPAPPGFEWVRYKTSATTWEYKLMKTGAAFYW